MGKSSNLARVVDASGGIGYQAGSGGAVTQATSKGTSVTLNKPSGQITMNNAALAAGAIAAFVVNNSLMKSTDSVVLTMKQDGVTNLANYNVWPLAASADGSFIVCIRNIAGASLSEAPIINFAIVKGAAA